MYTSIFLFINRATGTGGIAARIIKLADDALWSAIFLPYRVILRACYVKGGWSIMALHLVWKFKGRRDGGYDAQAYRTYSGSAKK